MDDSLFSLWSLRLVGPCVWLVSSLAITVTDDTRIGGSGHFELFTFRNVLSWRDTNYSIRLMFRRRPCKLNI